MWAVLYNFLLVIFIHFKLNCIHFSSAKATIKARLFSLLLLKFSTTALRACLVNDVDSLIYYGFLWFFFLYKIGVETTRVPRYLIIMNYNYRVYSFSWTTCHHYAIHYCSIKESCVISSRTTTFHHRLLCEHTLHFLHLQPPHLPQESCVCQAIFCWINTESDPHCYTLRTLSTSYQQPVKAHLFVSVTISLWSFQANLLQT